MRLSSSRNEVADMGSESEDFKDDEDEDDEAIVVALPMVSTSSRVSGKTSPILPGTPLSTTSSSARSSQDSSSASSTKQLLPKPSTIISIASSGSSLVSVQSNPVTIVPASAATILNVAPTDLDEETC